MENNRRTDTNIVTYRSLANRRDVAGEIGLSDDFEAMSGRIVEIFVFHKKCHGYLINIERDDSGLVAKAKAALASHPCIK